MIFKEFTLKSHLPEQMSTEIMYEIASARADRVELLRINIACDNLEDISDKKRFSTLVKLLKDMKKNTKIQFFATEDSFKLSKTEAIFLQNKYPEHLNDRILGERFVYVKL